MAIDHPIDHKFPVASLEQIFILYELKNKHEFVEALLGSIFLISVHVLQQIDNKGIEAVDCLRFLVEPNLKCEFDLSNYVLLKILNFHHRLLIKLIELLNNALITV